MTEAPVRVLHVLGRLAQGGAENRIMDLYREMDRSSVQFDFLVHSDVKRWGRLDATSDELMLRRKAEDFDSEVLELGGRIYCLPRLALTLGRTGLFSYMRACDLFFAGYRKLPWRVVQGHMTSTAAIYLRSAKRAGISVTIAHARSAGRDPGLKGALTYALRLPLRDERFFVKCLDGRMAPVVDHRLACSSEAARAVFGRVSAHIVPNAIRVDDFSFDEGARTAVRCRLGLNDCLVVGHVGTFRYAKNHELLIRVFSELSKNGMEKARLLLVGDGTLLQKMKDLVLQLGLAQKVIFAGNQRDVSGFYQAMDVFAFPSHYEGLPGSVLEAQAAGLPCLLSDAVTRDVDVTDLVRRESIGDGALLRWSNGIAGLLGRRFDRAKTSKEGISKLRAAGFDVREQARALAGLYTGEDTSGTWRS